MLCNINDQTDALPSDMVALGNASPHLLFMHFHIFSQTLLSTFSPTLLSTITHNLHTQPVASAYWIPLVLFVIYKGVRKQTLVNSWLIATGCAFGILLYKQWWHDIWTILVPCLGFPLIAYEVERSKISFFLQSRLLLGSVNLGYQVSEEGDIYPISTPSHSLSTPSLIPYLHPLTPSHILLLCDHSG